MNEKDDARSDAPALPTTEEEVAQFEAAWQRRKCAQGERAFADLLAEIESGKTHEQRALDRERHEQREAEARERQAVVEAWARRLGWRIDSPTERMKAGAYLDIWHGTPPLDGSTSEAAVREYVLAAAQGLERDPQGWIRDRPASPGGATAGEIALAIARKYRKRVDDESMEKALRRLTRDRLLVRIKGTTYYKVAREPLTDEEVEKLAEVEFQRQIAATGKINVKAAAEKLREMGASLNREDFNRRDSLIKLVTDYRKKSKA